MNRRNFLKAAILGTCAASVSVLVTAEPYFDPESIQRAVTPGLETFWTSPNGETITGMMEFNGILYAETESAIYAVDAKGRTIHEYPTK